MFIAFIIEIYFRKVHFGFILSQSHVKHSHSFKTSRGLGYFLMGGIYRHPQKNLNLSPKKLFVHQQNLTIPVNLIFNPNHKKLPKFSESIIKIMKMTQ